MITIHILNLTKPYFGIDKTDPLKSLGSLDDVLRFEAKQIIKIKMKIEFEKKLLLYKIIANG